MEVPEALSKPHCEHLVETFPAPWTITPALALKLPLGSRCTYVLERGTPHESHYNRLAAFITEFADGRNREVVFAQTDDLEREYVSVRDGIVSSKKESTFFMNVILALLSGALFGVGAGFNQTLVLAVALGSILVVVQLYYRQVLKAKRLRLRELESALGYEQLQIVALMGKSLILRAGTMLILLLFFVAFIAMMLINWLGAPAS